MDNQSCSDPRAIRNVPGGVTDFISVKQGLDVSDHASPGKQSTVLEALKKIALLNTSSPPLFAIDQFSFKSNSKAKEISLAIYIMGITLVLVFTIGVHRHLKQHSALVVMPVEAHDIFR